MISRTDLRLNPPVMYIETVISLMKGPILAIWEARDLDVAPERSAEVYRKTLGQFSPDRIGILPEATHGLLRPSSYSPGQFRLGQVNPISDT